MIAVRMFEPTDLDSCASLLIDASRGVLGMPASMERAREYLEDVYGMIGFGGLVAVEGKRTVGFLMGFRRRWLEGDEFQVVELGVDPAWSGRGVADELVTTLKRTLAGKGYRSMEVMTSHTVVSTHFYERHGFHPDPTVQYMRALL
ncbi:MAG: GNAT family N-acetyltransferase [Coriobacteriia bacterium]